MKGNKGKEKIFKEHINIYVDKFIGYAEEQCVFTELVYKAFLECALANNWPYNEKLNKGYFIRILGFVLREKFPGKFIGIKPVEGITNASFASNMGYSSNIIENIDWLDRTLSPHCIESTKIIGHYSTLKDFRIKRKSSYLSPEITLQETLTRQGMKNILKRGQNMDYLKENFNHPRNVIQFCFGIASQNERLEKMLQQLLDELQKQKK